MIVQTLEGRRAFIRDNTRFQPTPHAPELSLHLADEITPIWKLTEEALEEIGLPPPFWAFAWAGGQALARYILDNPETVAGKRVIDFATGSGIVAIAATWGEGEPPARAVRAYNELMADGAPRLDGVSPQRNFVLVGHRQPLSRRDAELPLDQIETGDRLGDRGEGHVLPALRGVPRRPRVPRGHVRLPGRRGVP